MNTALVLMSAILLAACAKETDTNAAPPEPDAAPSQAPNHKNIGPAEAKKLLDGEMPPVVLDIRTQFEVNAGRIDGSTHIDYYGKNFKEEVAKLDRDKPLIVHCRSGGRSTESLGIFKELGFKNVYHLDGGILAWEKSGLGLIKPTP